MKIRLSIIINCLDLDLMATSGNSIGRLTSIVLSRAEAHGEKVALRLLLHTFPRESRLIISQDVLKTLKVLLVNYLD